MPARSRRSITSKAAASSPRTAAVKQESISHPVTNDEGSAKSPSASTRSTRTSARHRKLEPSPKVTSTPKTARKRKVAEIKSESTAKDEQVKNEDNDVEDANIKLEEPSPKRQHIKKPSVSSATKTKNKKKAAPPDLNAGAKMAAQMTHAKDSQVKSEDPATHAARTKANPYGLSPGESPFPTYKHPTPEECREVDRILQGVHGKVSAPKTIPTPSLNSSGCGEVPSVLDALVRTRLSAATNNANSSRAFRGLVEKFGLLKTGVGKGSVDWNKVRLAPVKDVFTAIQSGGLADVKSRDIQKILNMVHEENQERKAALAKQESGLKDDEVESAGEKQSEIAKAKADVLSLDHLHTMGNDEAFNKLLGYPGIGPKTASCVLLFCMQRPSFAVDTHVFRLTKWLGWVPTDQAARAMMKRGEAKSAQVTRNSCYAHCEVRVPDEMKYSLHYLLIRHGKECGWCSAKAGQAAKVGICPLAGLMKGKGRSKGSAKAKKEVKGEDLKEEDQEEEDNDGDGDGDEDEEQEEISQVDDEEVHGLKV